MRAISATFLALAAGFAASAMLRAAPRFLDKLSRRHLALAVAVVAAAVAALVPSASSTGTPVLDGAYRGLIAGLTTYLGARLHPAVLAVATAATAALSAGHGGAFLAAVAAAGALAAWAVSGRSTGSGRSRPPAAVVAGCCAVSLLQPGAGLPRGLSALASGAIIALICLLGYREAPDPVRRRLRRFAAGAVALFAVAGAGSLVALAQARSSLEAGVAGATDGVARARQLDSPGAAAAMRSAAGAFDRATAKVGSPWGRAGEVVPLLGQQVRAVQVASASGEELGRAGADLAEAVDQQSLAIANGRIPLERLEAAQPKAARAASAIAVARRDLDERRSPWLLPPLATRLDRVQVKLAEAGDQADRAAALLAEVPPLLGSKGPRRYFVAVQTPSELRGSGGFMGSFAEIAAEDGRLTLTRTGRPNDLNRDTSTPNRTLDAPPDFLARYGRFDVANTWESVTISPHFPADAQVIRSLYPQSGGRPVDAVVAIDPFAIQALLKVVGPIQVPGAPAPLTGDNAAQVLGFEQYKAFGDGQQNERRDFLAGAIQALTERILAGQFPVRPMATALGPMVEQKHLMISAGAAAEEPAFSRLGLTGAMAPVQGDALAVVVQNGGASKIDWFLRRTIDYAATVDPESGALSSKATIQLTNQSPASGLPAYLIGNSFDLPLGTSRLYVSIYSPLLLQDAKVDDQPLLMESETEQGRSVYSAFIDIPPGATRTLTLDLTGAILKDRPYRLDLHRQPSAAADEVTVTVASTDGTELATRREFELTRDQVLGAPPAR